MKKRIALILVVIGVLLAVASTAGAVTWGVPDGNAHPYVGTLLFRQNGVGWYSCTGTLLSPTVMVTAGHCTEEAGNVNDVTYVRFTEDALAGRTNYPSTQAWLDAEWIPVKQVIPHPQYDDFSQFPLTYDVGVVILAKPVKLSTYGKLPSLGFLNAITSKNNSFTVVGYGMQGYLKPFESDIWARYKGTVRLIELNSTNNGGQGAKFTNNPGSGGDSGGSCYGDSGGPVFYGNTTTVTAVVSWGKTPCIGVDYQFRLDTPTALNFVKPYVK